MITLHHLIPSEVWGEYGVDCLAQAPEIDIKKWWYNRKKKKEKKSMFIFSKFVCIFWEMLVSETQNHFEGNKAYIYNYIHDWW